MTSERTIQTDVLVIGGGMAGMFAAMKAKEQGMDVTITDKAYVGKAGSTHFSEGDILYYRPANGHKIEEWLKVISPRCEYLNNREWDRICLEESEDRFKDLESWGVSFLQKDGQINVFTMMGWNTPYKDITMHATKFAPTIRKKLIEKGVRIVDNIMVSELLKQDGRIIGALGFHVRSGNLYLFQSGATVIATGSSAVKSGTYPVHFWTGDGDAMAYRAGSEIVSKEFMYGQLSSRIDVKQQAKDSIIGGTGGNVVDSAYENPFAIGGGFSGWFNRPIVNAEGDPAILPAWEAHQGRAPLYFKLTEWPPERMEWLREYFRRIELAWDQADKIDLDVFRGGKVKWPPSRIMTNSIFSGSGIWPINTDCASAVPGLYAAGNSCGTMGSGASYAGGGFGSNHAMVTGARAGTAAAIFAKANKTIIPDEIVYKATKESVCYPIQRRGGFSPGWVTQIIQSISVPYFYLLVKHEKRLTAALTIAEFINSQLVPQLMAKDAHEWRLAQETRNMALIVEMRLRASLFRTESRGSHFREDYPKRDDPNWLAWVKIKDQNRQMKLIKEPIPEEWWPDLSLPYEQRYPNMLPLE